MGHAPLAQKHIRDIHGCFLHSEEPLGLGVVPAFDLVRAHIGDVYALFVEDPEIEKRLRPQLELFEHLGQHLLVTELRVGIG